MFRWRHDEQSVSSCGFLFPPVVVQLYIIINTIKNKRVTPSRYCLRCDMSIPVRDRRKSFTRFSCVARRPYEDKRSKKKKEKYRVRVGEKTNVFFIFSQKTAIKRRDKIIIIIIRALNRIQQLFFFFFLYPKRFFFSVHTPTIVVGSFILNFNGKRK